MHTTWGSGPAGVESRGLKQLFGLCISYHALGPKCVREQAELKTSNIGWASKKSWVMMMSGPAAGAGHQEKNTCWLLFFSFRRHHRKKSLEKKEVCWCACWCTAASACGQEEEEQVVHCVCKRSGGLFAADQTGGEKPTLPHGGSILGTSELAKNDC